MDGILSLTLRKKVREKVGGRVKAWVSGGAPLNPEVGIFFQSLGITFLQGYGQTEAAPLISCNRPSVGIRLDTVGPPAGCEVRIAEDGEIMVRGENVMHGYWRNDEETARVLKDGWLATGDVGHFDDKGRIVITDRKKDLIVNDKGDNFSPQRIEGMLTLQPEIAQAMVYGDRRPHLVALLVPDPEIASKHDVQQRASTRGRPRQCGSVGDRKGAALHPGRRALHDRKRATDAIDENPAPRHFKSLWRAARRALSSSVAAAWHSKGSDILDPARADRETADRVEDMHDVALAIAQSPGLLCQERVMASGKLFAARRQAHQVDSSGAELERDGSPVDDLHVIGLVIGQATAFAPRGLAGEELGEILLCLGARLIRFWRRRAGRREPQRPSGRSSYAIVGAHGLSYGTKSPNVQLPTVICAIRSWTVAMSPEQNWLAPTCRVTSAFGPAPPSPVQGPRM